MSKVRNKGACFLVAVAGSVVLAATPASSAGPPGTWTPTGSMQRAREGGGSGLGTVATRLADGRVLVAGGYDAFDHVFDFDKKYYVADAELYDPTSGTWEATGSMNVPRYAAALVTLPNGWVLAAGGTSGSNAPVTTTAELYNPKSGKWNLTKSMSTCRTSATASVLADGRVLMAGGVGCPMAGAAQASAEIFDPQRKRWDSAASMKVGRWGHSGTVLADGRVLVAGGRSSPVTATVEAVSAAAELYDPATDSWTSVAPMHDARFLHAATLLPNNKVLVAGGHCPGGDPSPVMGCTLATAEVFDPATGAWTRVSSMSVPRVEGSSASLPGGKFLMAGGGLSATAEIFNPVTGTWTPTGAMSRSRDDAQLVALESGDLLIVGGFSVGPCGYCTTATTELFHPPAG